MQIVSLIHFSKAHFISTLIISYHVGKSCRKYSVPDQTLAVMYMLVLNDIWPYLYLELKLHIKPLNYSGHLHMVVMVG